jgi:phage tail sheath protein FI
MPIQVSYPGVYVQEIPGGQPTVASVSTASTAFVDFFARGPMNEPVRVASMQDVERTFGGLDKRSEASYGLRQYFLNGGQEGWVVRTGNGMALKSKRRVAIKTPGLPARVKASFEAFLESKKAAELAVKKAMQANQALQDLQKPEITDQQREQGTVALRDRSTEAAAATRDATDATRAAAVQAKAASDELAIEIAKVAAASGPVADRTAMAARKSADGAEASSDAAEATSQVAAVAQRALAVAKVALQTGSAARTAGSAANSLQGALTAVGASAAAADAAAKETEDAGKATDLVSAQQAAGRASTQAAEAAAQALAAVEAAAAAAQAVLDRLKAQKAPADALKPAQDALTDAKGADGKSGVEALVRAQIAAANDVDWAVQTAADLAAAQAAATQANAVAVAAKGLAGEGDKPADKNAKGIAVSLLAAVLKMASTAAADAANIAGKDVAADKPAPVGPVVKDAIDTISKAIDAAKRAVQAARSGAQDAKVAADCVTSGGPMMAAKAAENAAGKMQKETVEIVAQANSTKLKINAAGMTALASVAPAVAAGKDAETAAATPPPNPADGVTTALTASQAALSAADNAKVAAETVEQAAIWTSKVAVQASLSADVAAQAAQAAVQANAEANLDPTLIIEAINEGVWGDNLEISLVGSGTLFDVSIREMVAQNGVIRVLNTESYSNITVDPSSAAKPAVERVNHESKMIRLSQMGPKIDGAYPEDVKGKFLDGGNDGGLANADQLLTAMYALDHIEPALFNLLCLPAAGNFDDAQAFVTISAASEYCRKKRAFFIVDIPERVRSVDDMLAWSSSYTNAQAYTSATYFPRLVLSDPLNDYRPRNVGPSGTLAGIYSRTDTARGVWKAPAGVDAVLQGVDVAVRINDDLNGQLNPRGLNVLRSFPIYGNIAWGARTLAGADALSSEYKYINVRRLMNFIEESIFRSMKWAVFEPNNEVLWGKIRLQCNGFLADLFAKGAFQGPTPATSYFVQCDGKSTTPLDIDLGVVNVLIGVAPVKPAEFIVLQFQQIAGRAA